MPLNWHTLKFDEQFFQSVLSAAFTIQEHNDRGKLAGQTPARQTQADPKALPETGADRLSEHSGAVMPADALRCGGCGTAERCPTALIHPNNPSLPPIHPHPTMFPQR